MSPLVIPVVALVAFLLTQDKPTDRIVLLPQADGKPSALVVKTAGGEAVLDKPYAAADVGRKGAIAVGQTDAAAVQERFGPVLAAQPPRPVSYVVYFVSGGNELTPESKAVFDEIKAELLRRPAPEIAVIGHTDRVGALTANDALSLKRAEAVRDTLVGAGIDGRQIEAAGRGEREPAVPTADEVAEPRNRRVEINVR